MLSLFMGWCIFPKLLKNSVSNKLIFLPINRYTGGLTATGPALHYVLNNLIMSHSTGARSNAKKVVFVLTDGYSNTGSPRNPSIPAGKLKARGVQVHIMGVTTSISKTELNSIASKPNFVYHATNGYSTLSTVIRKLKKGV